MTAHRVEIRPTPADPWQPVDLAALDPTSARACLAAARLMYPAWQHRIRMTRTHPRPPTGITPTPKGHPMTEQLIARVREIRREIRIDLNDAPTLTNLNGQTRKPHGLRLTYGIRRDIARVDITVEWEHTAEYWPPAAEMPDWLRDIVTSHQPADVDNPDTFRPAGLGGWPLVIARLGTASAA